MYDTFDRIMVLTSNLNQQFVMSTDICCRYAFFIMACQKRKKSILSFLARCTNLNINSYVKIGNYVKDNPFTYQNVKTELKIIFSVKVITI